MSRRWTTEEIKKLKLISQGIQNIIIDRTPIAIANKIRDLGLKQDRRYELWTPKEISLLRQGKPIHGRSKQTVERKRIALGIHKREPRFRWKTQDEQQLRFLCGQGKSALDIHKEKSLPDKYTINSIQQKMCRLGLAKRSTTKYVRFPEQIKLKFEKFLIDNWQGKLPQELADMWNNSNYNFQVKDKRVIRYLSQLNIKVSCYEMGKIKRLRQKEEAIKQSTLPNNKKLDESIKAERIKIMQARLGNDLDIWTGQENK